MKRFIPYAFVALLVLVPAGFVLAAKSTKPKKSAETKAAHRSAKQKAANDKLVQELLAIMEETDNKMTFAACAECLAQLKPPREVVVPALIRKADKLGMFKANPNGSGNDEMEMMGDIILSFLPHKKSQQPNVNGCPLPMPGAACFAPPLPTGYAPPLPPSPYAATVYPNPQSLPCPTMPASYTQPVAYPPMPPCPQPTISWEAATRYPAPATSVVPMALAAPAAATDKMTAELLKILEETDSKVTFEVVVGTLAVRDQNWEMVIPTILRKADKMGWLKANDKDFTDDIAELIATKANAIPKVAPLPPPQQCSILFNGVSCDDGCKPCVDDLGQLGGCALAAGTPVGKCVSGVEMIAMPRTTEVVPMPQRKAMPRPQE